MTMEHSTRVRDASGARKPSRRSPFAVMTRSTASFATIAPCGPFNPHLTRMQFPAARPLFSESALRRRNSTRRRFPRQRRFKLPTLGSFSRSPVAVLLLHSISTQVMSSRRSASSPSSTWRFAPPEVPESLHLDIHSENTGWAKQHASDATVELAILTVRRARMVANSFAFDLKETLIIPSRKFLGWSGFVQDGPWKLAVKTPRRNSQGGFKSSLTGGPS